MLKFFGTFSLVTGSLSAAVAMGGGATGARFAAPSVSGRPCAHEGGVGAGCAAAAGDEGCGAGPAGACCAASGHGAARRPTTASNNIRECDKTDVMVILPTGADRT